MTDGRKRSGSGLFGCTARAIHMATGLAVVATEARSQHLNRGIALNRLLDILAEREAGGERQRERLARLRLQRGNPARVYEGESFARVK